VLAAAVAAFGGCLAAPFVFDDFALMNDPAVASVSGWWQCWRLSQTRPLTWFTFWMNYQLGGANPAGYHAVNLVLHLAVVALLWDVLRRLMGDRIAVAAAAIFAVHPLLTEPVAYVFERGTLLAALFSLLAVRSWIRTPPDRESYTAVLWFALAMLAKEECAALPLFLGLLDISRSLRLRWRSLVLMLGIALGLGLRAVWAAAATPGSQAGAHAGISAAAYLAAQGVVILRYLRMLIIPWGFSVDYPATPPAAAAALVSWSVVGLLGAVSLYRFRGLRAGFWFLAGLLLLAPSSSIFPAADLEADRRMYLPMLAFSACVALLLDRVDRRVMVGIVAMLAGISFYYTGLWRNPQALWSAAVRRAPDKLRPRLQLARTLPPERALPVLEQARLLAPGDSAVAAEMGRVLLALGRPSAALAEFGRALALDPSDPGALNNRGAALLALGQPAAARADFDRALARDPCLFDARLNLRRMGVETKAPEGCRYTSRQERMLGR
jgi:protein O-mannosyl-transferase